MPSDVPPPSTALVLGGASDIGLAIARRLGARGLHHVVLAARDPEALRHRLEADPLPSEQVGFEAWDALDPLAHEPLLERATARLGRIDLVVCAVGALGHHAGLPLPVHEADLLMRTNFSGPAAAILVAGRSLAAAGGGTIVVLSSVAGARARRSNFVYGSAKAGLDAFAQGLGDALEPSGVRVHVVRPGFVVSKMTTGLEPAPFATTPEAVAEAVLGVVTRPRSRVVWVPSVLGPILGVMRNVPSPVWRRISGDR